MDFTQDLYNGLLFLMLLLAPFVLVILFYIPAPYGRYARPGWGPTIDNRLGWSIMESPAALLMLIPFIFVTENIRYGGLVDNTNTEMRTTNDKIPKNYVLDLN